MKKTVYLILLCATLCIILTSCGIPKPPQESNIMEDIPDEITTVVIGNPFDELNLYVYDMNVTSVSIEKRQTNDKEDTAYCIVELENEYYQLTRYLKMIYNYYDKGGWILDDYSEYKDMDWKLIDCSLNAEDVAFVCDYSQVEFRDSTFDPENGAASFSFDVEDVHENGVYKGVAIIDCQFDGEKWTYTKNTENVHFIWDIVGTWKYSKIEKTSYDSVVNEIVLMIQDFDQTLVSMDGTWYMNGEFSLLGLHSETLISLDNAERVEIGMDRTLIELWENPNQIGMHSYVRFHPDSVEANYATHFGPVYLERTDYPDNSPTPPSSTPEATDAEDIVAWNKLVEQYFVMMETNDQDVILPYMLEAGPYGDDISIRGEHLQQYEIAKTEHSNEFFMNNYDELLGEIELIKHELKEHELKSNFNLNPEDIASLYVQAEFTNPEIGIVEYRFWFVKDSGIWVLFYVDEVW